MKKNNETDCAKAHRISKSHRDRIRASECWNACASLPSPAENIKELVEAAKAMLEANAWKGAFLTSNEAIKLQEALAPFEGEGK